MAPEAREDTYGYDNETVRIELFTRLEKKMEAPLMAFFRHLGVSHVYWELMVPVFDTGEGAAFVAIEDRPWPPWGIGAQEVHALMLVFPVTEHWAGLSNIFLLDEDLGNIGLAAALYNEGLKYLIQRKVDKVRYVLDENSVFAGRTLGGLGFDDSDEFVLTRKRRYIVHEADTQNHYRKLGLDDVGRSDLLAATFNDDLFNKFAQLLGVTTMGTAPFWDAGSNPPEILPNAAGVIPVSGGAPKTA